MSLTKIQKQRKVQLKFILSKRVSEAAHVQQEIDYIFLYTPIGLGNDIIGKVRKLILYLE